MTVVKMCGLILKMSRKVKKTNISSLSTSYVSLPTTLAIIFIIVAIFLARYFTFPSDSSSTTTPPSSVATKETTSILTTSSEDSSQQIPTYNEYLALAKQNKWSPTDPVMKLMEISHQWSQLINLQNMSQTYEVLKLMNFEIQFLTQIFMKSNDHLIDLTEIFHDSLEGIHRSIYHLEKQILQYQQER
jgi:hypothetical protein